MDIKRQLSEQEEELIFKAIDDFREHASTEIKCPICQGNLKYTGNNSSFSIICDNCGILYSLRGI